MRVADVMTKNPCCCTPDTKLDEVARLMVEHDCGEVPIVDKQGKTLGVITDRDITCRVVAAGKNPLELKASQCMSEPVVTLKPDADIEECCKTMEKNQVRRVPVVDEKGCCCGIVSQADVASRLGERAAGEILRDVSKPNPHASAAPQH